MNISRIALFTLSLLLINCKKDNPLETINSQKADTIKMQNHLLPIIIDDAELEKQIVIIYDNGYEKLCYSKNDLNKIVKLFPTVNEQIVREPIEAYLFSGIWKEYINSTNKKETYTFGSEAGQDNFYLVYAYFLKKKNDEIKYDPERKTLIELYKAINEIYGTLNYGGTFYGHQNKRLIGEAEYSVHCLIKNTTYYQKNYNFSKQKKYYLEALKQYILDEESINVENKIDKLEAEKRMEKFHQKIATIEKLTTNYFYLNQVQNFEIKNYK